MGDVNAVTVNNNYCIFILIMHKTQGAKINVKILMLMFGFWLCQPWQSDLHRCLEKIFTKDVTHSFFINLVLTYFVISQFPTAWVCLNFFVIMYNDMNYMYLYMHNIL